MTDTMISQNVGLSSWDTLYTSILVQVLVHCLICRQRRMPGLVLVQLRDTLGGSYGLDPSESPLIIGRSKWEKLVKVICILYKTQFVPHSKHSASLL